MYWFKRVMIIAAVLAFCAGCDNKSEQPAEGEGDEASVNVDESGNVTVKAGEDKVEVGEDGSVKAQAAGGDKVEVKDGNVKAETKDGEKAEVKTDEDGTTVKSADGTVEVKDGKVKVKAPGVDINVNQ